MIVCYNRFKTAGTGVCMVALTKKKSTEFNGGCYNKIVTENCYDSDGVDRCQEWLLIPNGIC